MTHSGRHSRGTSGLGPSCDRDRRPVVAMAESQHTYKGVHKFGELSAPASNLGLKKRLGTKNAWRKRSVCANRRDRARTRLIPKGHQPGPVLWSNDQRENNAYETVPLENFGRFTARASAHAR